MFPHGNACDKHNPMLDLWHKAQLNLAAKTLAECDYEECFRAQPTNPDELSTQGWQLTLNSGVQYQFNAKRSIWGFLLIDAYSLRRNQQPLTTNTEDAAHNHIAVQLVLDAQHELGMDDIVLGRFVEELQNTLYSEWQRLKSIAPFSARQLTQLPDYELQGILSGHPKALANKGRMGWGVDDLERYSPESRQRFQLRYIAVRDALANTGLHPQLSKLDLLKQCLNSFQLRNLEHVMSRKKLHLQDYWVVPVHPWQWQAFIQVQYAHYFVNGDMVDLGVHGDQFCAQQSIRTLSNTTRPHCQDIKLALTILNTSCYRGIPGKHIASGADLSQWLGDLVDNDPVLSAQGLIVLQERAGIHVPHPMQQTLTGSPYRYQEMLGAVWRDSLSSHCKRHQKTVLMATLMETDADGQPLIAEYISQSGLTTQQWLHHLFNRVVVPLYHLLCQYGVGVIAHGQNVALILENGVPVHASIKDFHGDLRIVNQDFAELATLPDNVMATLTRLPAEHLIHDLVTGHFVTTLRFISPLVERHLDVSETEFYAILRSCLTRYMAEHPELNARYKLFPLLEPNILKICINRVRFRIGYNDDAQRPIPELGQPLTNPLSAPIAMEKAS